MPTRIYIGRLPYRASERDVEKFFSGYGNISDVILKKGFGFVDFEDPRDAEDAIHERNNRELCGARIVVESCKDMRGDRRDGGRPSYSSGGGFRERGGPPGRGGPRPRWMEKYGTPEQTRYRMTVENLSTRCSWQDLKDLMRSCGEVTYADAHKKERNTALVCFARHEDLRRAIEKFQGKDINGRKIKLIDDTRDTSRSRSPHSRSHSRSRSPRSRSRSPPGRSRSRSPRSRSRS